jgi:hypothetical protein
MALLMALLLRVRALGPGEERRPVAPHGVLLVHVASALVLGQPEHFPHLLRLEPITHPANRGAQRPTADTRRSRTEAGLFFFVGVDDRGDEVGHAAGWNLEFRRSMAARPLTVKQRRFVRHYLETGNGTQAALIASNPNTAHAIACENLQKAAIQQVSE